MPKISIVHTTTGPFYARRIANSIRWRYDNGRCSTRIDTELVSVNELHRIENDEGTLIHARAAHPRTRWMAKLEEIEQNNLVINTTRTLKLTSDKLASSLLFSGMLPNAHPMTWEYTKGDELPDDVTEGDYVLKPFTSMAQGANVRRYNFPSDNIREIAREVPGNTIILQECVPYVALHRVIVINGIALPYTFIDLPTDDRWRVSVCLNRTSMQFVSNPDTALLALAVRAQVIVGGEINFVDIFETNTGYKIGEINTACNLRIHERMAQSNGRRDWNIHYKIACYLEGRLLAL